MNRVLVVVTRQIGDVLLTTPLVHAARQRWPSASVDVLGFEGTLGMLEGNPDVHQAIGMPARPGVAGALRWIRRLWRRYDLALVADGGDRAHLLGWIAARRRSGLLPEEGRSNWWKRRLLAHAVPAAGDRGAVHVVQEKLALLGPWRQEATAAPAVIPPSPLPLPADLDAAITAGAVVVHAPSMWDYKQWPVSHFARVIEGLVASGRQVVLTGSGSERDQACLAQLRPLLPSSGVIDTSGRLGFRQLAALFQRAGLYVGPDTSVSHLAAACGVQVLAVFGPTNPMRWAPWPARAEAPIQWVKAADRQHAGNVTLLQADLPCVPCGRAGCEDHRASRSDCLPAIGPERVLAEAQRLLATGQ